MINLICEQSQTNYTEVFIAFFVIMTVIGFVLIMIDKKRWKAHKDRSADMVNGVAYKKPETIENELDELDDTQGKKSKKSKSKDPNDYEYESRIKDRVLIPIAILFGGIGELLGMIVFRHKWYSPIYKIAMPLIAILNFAMMFIIVFAFQGVGGDGFHFSA